MQQFSEIKQTFYKGYCVILSLIEIRLRCRGGFDSITSWTIAITKEDTISKHFGFIKSKNVDFFSRIFLKFVYIRCMICRLNKPNRSRFETIRSPFPNTSMTHCYVISSPKLMPKWAFLITFFARPSVYMFVSPSARLYIFDFPSRTTGPISPKFGKGNSSKLNEELYSLSRRDN